LEEHPEEDFIIRIVGAREGDTVQYNILMTDDLAMLIVGDFHLTLSNVTLLLKLEIES
jgi:hypothetical protein